MTQKEFEERTGLKLTADNYIEVETCYMNTDLDKDAFCKLWMKNPAALKEIEQKTVLVRELYEERKCLANFLIEQAEKWSASDLREKAIAMIGERESYRPNFITWIFWTAHPHVPLSPYPATVKRIGAKKRCSERGKRHKFLIHFSSTSLLWQKHCNQRL